MKRLFRPPRLLLIASLLVSFTSNAQQLVGPGASTVSDAYFSVTYSLGEVSTITMASSSNSITQGYLQSRQSTNTVTGISSSEEATSLRIYPNPFVGSIKVFGFDVERVVVMNCYGVILFDETVNSNNIDLDELSPGTYFIKFINKQNQFSNSYKIMKL